MSAAAGLSSLAVDGPAPVRTLIVDDSVVARTVLNRILGDNPRFQVSYKATNADEALDFLGRESVDLILLDIEMPGQSGLTALPAIQRLGGSAKIVILSSNCEEGSAAAVEALAIGARDVLSKPTSGTFNDSFTRMLVTRLLRLVGTSEEMALDGISLRSVPEDAYVGCLGIGASTGGIHALGQMFGAPGRPRGVPILITQHLPPSFMPYFAVQMSRMTGLPAKVAEDGDVLQADHIYVAPGEAHLGVKRIGTRVRVELTTQKSAHNGVPAVDPMFAAMAKAYGNGALGLVLTGMGRDGTAGARAIVEHGGWMVVQDQGSSVVWGMPGSIARAGLASAVLRPEGMLPFLARGRGNWGLKGAA